jgi:hypothetical protein
MTATMLNCSLSVNAITPIAGSLFAVYKPDIQLTGLLFYRESLET